MSKAKVKPKTAPRLVGDWVSAKDACQYMDISYGTLKTRIDKGQLVATKAGGKKVLVSVHSIRALMDQTITPVGA